MNYQNYKKHLFYPAFAAILAIVLLAMSDTTVKSQRAADTEPSPFKFKRLPEPKKDIPNRISARTSAGSLIDKSTTDFSSSENANAVAVQADGKIVAAGSVSVVGSNNATNYDFAVFRYNADGSLDTSFHADGKVTTPISNEFHNSDIAYAVAIQPDGKIIAGGNSSGLSGGAAALVRYNSDGSLDASFGAGGKVITSGYGAISEIALQTDGKIVAATYGFTVARYNGDGSLDASFGTGGIVATNFDGNTWGAYSVAVQADGKIVAAGYAGFCDEDNCFLDFALALYNTNGSPDTSFDTDGKVTTDFGNSDVANAVAIQADGKIVTAGYSYNNPDAFAVARYNGDGSLDGSFDLDGKVITNFSSTSYATSVVLQSDGKIVVSGTAYDATSDFALVRLNTDGSLDASFDGDGKLTTDFGNEYDFANDAAIQADGKIVTVGSGGNYPNDFALSRYNADGSLDAAFDGDGKQTTSFLVASSAANAVVIDERLGFTSNRFFVGYSSSNAPNNDFAIAAAGDFKTITPIGDSDDRANAASIDPSGRIVAAGYSHNGSDSDFALVRYHGNLTIDTSFDGDGKLTTDFGGSNDEAMAVVVQADYKIVVVGRTNAGTALALARYNHDGSLDASFGTGGKVINQSIQNAKAMAIQPDGKIIAAGNAPHTEPPFGDNFALARFHADGSLDTSFDGDGIAVTRFDFSSQINSVALQPYGKIVAAGFTRNNTGTLSEFALVRYHANGSLDTSFDTDGKVTTSFNVGSNAANAVSVQRNGKIVAVGVSFHHSTYGEFALARYNGNGSLDTTFDTDGMQTTDFFGDADIAYAAAIQRDGTIVTAGSARRGSKFDFAAALYTGDATPKVKYDYDDDGSADLGVFRPSSGVWYFNRSTQGLTATHFGFSTDKITPADFDGDGKTDIAVYRDGTWYWLNSSTNSFNAVQFGLPGDIPVPADYIGGDADELAVYRGGVWYYRQTFQIVNQFFAVHFGLPTDKPVPGDYDGDGQDDQAVYRDGIWYLNQSTQGFAAIHFGLPTDKLVPADYDGDGKTDLAVYRDGIWYLLQSSDGFAAFHFGLPSDILVPADYDGDGLADIAVYRDGIWYILQSSNGSVNAQHFGLGSDIPVASANTQ